MHQQMKACHGEFRTRKSRSRSARPIGDERPNHDRHADITGIHPANRRVEVAFLLDPGLSLRIRQRTRGSGHTAFTKGMLTLR